MPDFVVEHRDSRCFAVSAKSASEAIAKIVADRGFASFDLSARPRPKKEQELGLSLYVTIFGSLLFFCLVWALI